MGNQNKRTAIFYMGTNLGFVSAFAKFGRIITPEDSTVGNIVQCEDNKADRKIGEFWERAFCTMAAPWESHLRQCKSVIMGRQTGMFWTGKCIATVYCQT